jgi:hypothetical protein
MAKAIDLRIKGISFEEAAKRILSAPPLPKKPKKSARKKPAQNPQRK